MCSNNFPDRCFLLKRLCFLFACEVIFACEHPDGADLVSQRMAWGSCTLATEFPRAQAVCWASVAYLSHTAADPAPGERGRVCEGRVGAA